MSRAPRRSRVTLASLALAAAVAGLIGAYVPSGSAGDRARAQDVMRGRQLVMEHGCAGCHGADLDSPDGWLSGWRPSSPPGIQDFQIGPFRTRAQNLTPDTATGIGRYTDRQIFNALRFGLRPAETPDVEIISSVPGEGNFPAAPKYLAPPMPWTAATHVR